jgi:type I restriction enzyme S subunit
MVFNVAAFGLDDDNLPRDWKVDRLDTLASFNPEQVTAAYPHSEITYLDIANVAAGVFGEPETLFLADAPSRAKRIVKTGDTILSTVRPGNRAFAFIRSAPDNLVASTGFAVLRSKPNAEPRFVYYLATSDPIINYLASIAEEKTAYPSVNPDDIAECAVPVPPLSEQRAIAHILGTLDDKIELNRRMSETLEAMARALFKSWFVDFAPVRAKAEGRDPLPAPQGEAARQAGGLPKPLADLFPARLVDSELGEIPEGWEVAALPELIEVNPARSLRKGDVAPYLDMANMPTHGHAPDEVIERPFGSGMRFINGDTLVARITPCLENGKTAFVDFLREGQVGWGSTEYIVLRARPPLPPEFAYCLARSDGFREYAIQSMTGTSGRQRVQADSLTHFTLPRVPKPVAEAFGRTIKPLFVRSSGAIHESRALAALRDALLPRLISGELQVKDAKRFLVD